MTDWGALSPYDKNRQLSAQSQQILSRMREVRTDAKSLCITCEHGTVFRQRSRDRVVFVCQKLDREVPNDIIECTGYENPHELGLGQLIEMAVIIDPREGVNVRSFI